MSKVYSFCNGSNVSMPTTLVLSSSPCILDQTYYENNNNVSSIYNIYKSTITISGSTAPYENLPVNFSYHQVFTYNGNTTYDQINTDTIVLPAGQTVVSFQVECLTTSVYRDYHNHNNDSESNNSLYDYTLLDQAVVPACDGQGIGCVLEITSTLVTPPSKRGLSDGSINVSVSGCTGSTANVTYKLNGVLITNTGETSGHTITDLKTGIYNVYVTQTGCWDQVLNITVPDGEFRTGDFYTEVEPADIVAADNPIINNVTTAIVNPNAAKDKIKLTITGLISNNDSIEFNLTSPIIYNQTFTAKHFPNKTNYFVASTLTNNVGQPVGTNSFSEIATSLAQVLQNDALISKVYYVENSNTDVFLTAKENGSKFNLTTSNVLISSTGITFTKITSGQDKYDGQLVDNYSIYMEVFVNNSGDQFPQLGTNANYSKIAELQQPFNPLNQHKFNLSEIVKTQVSTPRPNKNVDVLVLTDPLRSFYCNLGEIYPLVPNTNTLKKRYKQNTGYFWAINASLPRENINDMSAYQGTYVDFESIASRENVPFLTNSPDTITILRNSEQYLYFLLEKDYGNKLNIQANIYYEDGTIDYGVNVKQITNQKTNAGGVCMLNVSFTNLGLDTFETYWSKKISYYDLIIRQESCTLNKIDFSTTKRYYVNENDYPNMFGVNFQNSLGMYDTFDFTGAIERTINKEVLTYTKPLNYNNGGGLDEGFKNKSVYDNKVTKLVTVNSGWIDEIHFDWLIELLNSKNIYSYTEQFVNYLIIKDQNYIKNSNDNLFNVTITFEQTIHLPSVSI